MQEKPKTLGVFTSGGDAPGMNAAIRAVVRTATYYGVKVYGIRRGYEGMIDGDFIEMDSPSVSNIIQRGGTILKTARCERFKTVQGMEAAYKNVKANGIEGLIALGGDGTFRGGLEFEQKYSIPMIGVPCTIDNDLFGTDYTIGFDTAINTALTAIDKIRDTADALNRLFFIEVMGHDAGFIAIHSGIAGGAEAILFPEGKTDTNTLINILEKGWKSQKSSSIVVVAEGQHEGGAFEVALKVKEKFAHYDTRVSVIGHMQRGGSPTCMDRMLASRLGVAAVENILNGERNKMVGMIHWNIELTPFEKATKHTLEVNPHILKIAEILSI